MIFYFSATGNCKYVATLLADATNDKTISITDCMRENSFDFSIKEVENIGFVTPTYFWGLPSIITDFMNKLKITTSANHYVYHVLTFGTSTGQAHRMMDNCLKDNSLSLDGKFIVQMVDTWTPIFNLTDKEKNQRVLNNAYKQINTIARYINSMTTGDFNNRKIPFAELYYRIYKNGRKTKKFTVENSCVGCGLCEKQCPVGAIKIQNSTPVWIKEQCTLCLGCLHRCPKFAIQYVKNTKKHGQFVNPNVKL